MTKIQVTILSDIKKNKYLCSYWIEILSLITHVAEFWALGVAMQAGPPCPAYFMRAKNTGLSRILFGLRIRVPPHFFFNFFFNFYDKTFNV